MTSSLATRFLNLRHVMVLPKAGCAVALRRGLSLCSHSLSKQDHDDNVLPSNPYYEKYADKIKKLQASAEFQGRKAASKREKRLDQEIHKWKKYHDELEGKFKTSEKSKKTGSKLPDSLNELMKVELLETKSAAEITDLWRERFKAEDSVSSVIPASEYHSIAAHSKASPLFLYPLPRSHGYEFILGQFEKNRCYFTSLLSYQVHGDNSPWHLCLTHYTELMDSKNIVLMASEMDNNALNVLEARYLAQLLKLFYSSKGPMYDLVCALNQKPDSFKYMDIVKAIEASNLVVK